MRKQSLLTAFILLWSFAFSQETSQVNKHFSTQGLYLDASAGFSVPVGAYGGSKIDDVSGFASPGVLAQLNLDWVGDQDYGLAVQYTFQSNSIKRSVKNDTLVGMAEALGTKGWTNNYLLAGLVVMKAIGKVIIGGKALAGIVLSESPVFRTMDPVYRTPSSNTGAGLGIGIQLNAAYTISRRVSLQLNVEYLQGYPKIHRQYGAQIVGIDTGYHIIYSPPVTIETKRVLSSFNIGAGVIVKLSK
jgi:hypothetical protein